MKQSGPPQQPPPPPVIAGKNSSPAWLGWVIGLAALGVIVVFFIFKGMMARRHQLADCTLAWDQPTQPKCQLRGAAASNR